VIEVVRELRPEDVRCPVCNVNWMRPSDTCCDECRCPGVRHPEWDRVMTFVERQVPASTYHQWLSSLHYHGEGRGYLLIGCDPTVLRYVEERYGNVLNDLVGLDHEVCLIPCYGRTP
jgi:hypothetical protein